MDNRYDVGMRKVTTLGIKTHPLKIIGQRQSQSTSSPLEYHQRASTLQLRVDRLNPFPKPRGFVFKAKSRAAYEAWKQKQANPRLW